MSSFHISKRKEKPVTVASLSNEKLTQAFKEAKPKKKFGIMKEIIKRGIQLEQ